MFIGLFWYPPARRSFAQRVRRFCRRPARQHRTAPRPQKSRARTVSEKFANVYNVSAPTIAKRARPRVGAFSLHRASRIAHRASASRIALRASNFALRAPRSELRAPAPRSRRQVRDVCPDTRRVVEACSALTSIFPARPGSSGQWAVRCRPRVPSPGCVRASARCGGRDSGSRSWTCGCARRVPGRASVRSW